MRLVAIAAIVFVFALTFVMSGFGPAATAQQLAGQSRADNERSGQAIFRYDTFGDEQLWTDVLRMHEVIATVDPLTALAVGLKVDVEALPRTIIAALRAGDVDLTNPGVTVELLRLNAVVGVQGMEEPNHLLLWDDQHGLRSCGSHCERPSRLLSPMPGYKAWRTTSQSRI